MLPSEGTHTPCGIQRLQRWTGAVRPRRPGSRHVTATIPILATAAAALVGSCGGEPAGPPPPPPPPPNRPPAATASLAPVEVHVGDTASIRISGAFSDPDGDALSFAATSSDVEVVAVALASGLVTVTAVGKGRAVVTVSATDGGGLSAQLSFAVTVPNRPPTAMDTIPALELLEGAARTVDLTGAFSDPDGDALTHTAISSRTTVVAVSLAGTIATVTGVGPGEVQVTVVATDTDGTSASQAFGVTVRRPAPVVTVTPPNAQLTAIDASLRLSAEVRDPAGRVIPGAAVTWASSAPSVVRVAASGLATAVRNGTATITATYSGSEGSASGTGTVRVAQEPRSVAVLPAAPTLGPGDTLRLSATAHDANGHPVEGAEFAWSSSAPSVAPVSSSGVVSGAAEGTATIAAAAGTARGTARVTVVNPDRDALEALYYATDGPNWDRNDGWLTAAPLGEWYGVETNALGRVTEIRLNVYDDDASRWLGNGLAGTIPPELGTIGSLEYLDLGYNELSGRIPAELGELANLGLLALGGNDLSGRIPPELGNLTNLWYLAINFNDLTGSIPPELGNLVNLNYLYAHWTGLTGRIPPALGNLAGLFRLWLAGNELTGPVPPELGDLVNVRDLWLGQNELTGRIPPELGNLVRLTELNLVGNRLTGPIPPELGNLGSLTTLALGGNDLTGPIPSELGRLTSLTGIWLYDTRVSGGIPTALGNLTALTFANLGGNRLTGPVPPDLGNLRELAWLSLANNRLSGPIPARLAELVSLEELDVSNNAGMAGVLPADMTSLTRLVEFMAGGTSLCAPSDPDFRVWLQGVPKRRVAFCTAAGEGAAYLTQAVQSRQYPVPLVAGERALLRVFPTAARATSQGIPEVRARLFLDGREAHVVDIPPKSAAIPTEVNEALLSRSSNAEIPGYLIHPGLELVVEVDPSGRLDPALGVTRRIPETGRLPVEVRAMPLFDLTVIPFVWAGTYDSSIVGLVGAVAADPERHHMLEDTRTLLPVGDLSVTAHDPVLSASNDPYVLLGETAAIRAIEGGGGHYMGMMVAPLSRNIGGVAHRPGTSSFAQPYASVVAHELGHNMNLRHAPCGDPAGVDPSFPYADGSIGAWGYDFGRGSLVSPSRPDLMSYCDPEWVSDYHFTNALGHRLISEGAAAPGAPAKSLLLWGGVRPDGGLYLEPAFAVDAPPLLPEADGEHRLTGYAADGTELFSLDFAMREAADTDGGAGFVFVLPMRAAWERDLVSLTLSGPGGSVTLDGASDLPMAIVRDPGSGSVRGILRDAPDREAVLADAAAIFGGGTEFEVQLSRGLPEPGAWRR